MTRPIEQNRANWCTVKEAAVLSGRDLRDNGVDVGAFQSHTDYKSPAWHLAPRA